MDRRKKVIGIVKLLFVMAVVGLWSMGCGSNREEQVKKDISVDSLSRVIVHPDEVAGIVVGYGDNEMIKADLTTSDIEKLARQIGTLRYDTAWNDRDIMVKMVVPDYTLILNYKDRTPEESDWLMFWKAEGRTKFRNKWYILPEKERELTYTLVESYRSLVN